MFTSQVFSLIENVIITLGFNFIDNVYILFVRSTFRTSGVAKFSVARSDGRIVEK